MEQVNIKDRNVNRIHKLLRHGKSSRCIVIPNSWLALQETNKGKVIAFELDLSNDSYLFLMPIFHEPSMTVEQQLSQYGDRLKLKSDKTKKIKHENLVEKPLVIDGESIDRSLYSTSIRVVTPEEIKRIKGQREEETRYRFYA